MASRFSTIKQDHDRAMKMAKTLLREETSQFAMTYATTILAAVIINNAPDHNFDEVDQIIDCFPIQLKLACREFFAARFN